MCHMFSGIVCQNLGAVWIFTSSSFVGFMMIHQITYNVYILNNIQISTYEFISNSKITQISTTELVKTQYKGMCAFKRIDLNPPKATPWPYHQQPTPK